MPITGAPPGAPALHAAQHMDGGADELDASQLAGALGVNCQFLHTDGAACSWQNVPAAGFYDAYVCVRDVKAQNTDGGTFTSGAWRTRNINNEQADTAGICAIAANQITLAAGTYRCLVSAPAYDRTNTTSHQTRLQNITDGVTLLIGTPERTLYAQTRSIIVGRFTLAAEKVLEVQHRNSVTRAVDGFGYAANFTDEIYTVAEFWREA